MADEEWRGAYAKLLKQIRAMQRQLTHAQAAARAVREHVAAERRKLHNVRTERRATARFDERSTDAETQEFRRRKKR